MKLQRHLLIACALIPAVCGSAEAKSADACTVSAEEKVRLLGLRYNEFDTDTAEFAWRSLNARSCTDQALRLVNDYAAAHSDDMTAAEKSEALFHMGQALTFANRNADSILYFTKALALATKDEWKTYVAAHVAYAKGDLVSLSRARDHYAEIAPKSMRLGFVNGLLACPRKPYMEAAHCAR